MKVICIDASPGRSSGRLPDFKEGDELTAIQRPTTDPRDYEILESNMGTWNKDRFIPISSIDETEFVREYKKELV